MHGCGFGGPGMGGPHGGFGGPHGGFGGPHGGFGGPHMGCGHHMGGFFGRPPMMHPHPHRGCAGPGCMGCFFVLLIPVVIISLVLAAIFA